MTTGRFAKLRQWFVNLYTLTFYPSPQWVKVSLWQRWRFMVGL